MAKEIVKRVRGQGTFLGEFVDHFGTRVEDRAAVAIPHQPPGDISAHAAKSNDADLHVAAPI